MVVNLKGSWALVGYLGDAVGMESAGDGGCAGADEEGGDGECLEGHEGVGVAAAALVAGDAHRQLGRAGDPPPPSPAEASVAVAGRRHRSSSSSELGV